MTAEVPAAAPAPGPFSRFEFLVAGRYLRARRKDTFISVIGSLTLAGIAIGVATLIVGMSVMNGFRDELLSKILGLNGHFTAYPIERQFTDYDQVVAELSPDSWKGYTIGDVNNLQTSQHPWRMDDEKIAYPVYEKIAKSGAPIVCVHKGLFTESAAKKLPRMLNHAGVSDVGKAAKDWPQINFVIYHSAYRWAGGGKAAGCAKGSGGTKSSIDADAGASGAGTRSRGRR